MKVLEELPKARRTTRPIPDIWDGRAYELTPDDLGVKSTNGVRAALRRAAKERGMKVQTRTIDDKTIAVQATRATTRRTRS